MSARLALDLDHDAIRLLSQQSDGWVVEGVAQLDSPDLTVKIGGLRQRAEDLGGADPAVLLVLPKSQVLYTSFEDLADPEREVGRLLESLTPYSIAEITWDHATAEGRTRVAAVALETIDEALAFAASSRFRVVGLTSEPPEGEFPRLPVFQRLPGFLRDGEPKRPLVLEPAAPPARKAVAFSGQRGANYAPKAAALTIAAAARTKKAAASAPARLAGLVAGVPKPLAGALAIGAVALVGAALWPEPDPDPFTKRGVDLSFAALPAAMVEGLAAPLPASAPITPDTGEWVTALRDAPLLSVPTIIGQSGVTADYVAAIAPARSFESIAALPALFGTTELPRAVAARPNLPAAPAFPRVVAIEAARVARASPPQTPTAPATEADPPALVAVAASALARTPVALPIEPGASTLPTLPETLSDPDLMATAPGATAPPVQGAPLGGAIAGEDAPIISELATALPTEGLQGDTLPDAASALAPGEVDPRFELGPDGFVVASPEGTPTPGGVLAFAGAPAVAAPPRPGSAAEAPLTAVDNAIAEAAPDAAEAEILDVDVADGAETTPGAPGTPGADGFVIATPEGTLTPGGVLAFAGAPALAAPPRPGSADEAPLATTTDTPPDAVAGASPAPLDDPQTTNIAIAEALADGTEGDALDPAEAEAQGAAPLELVTRANPNPELAAFTPLPRPARTPVTPLEAAPSVPDAVIAEALEAEAVEPEPEPVMTASLLPRPRPVRATPPSAPEAVVAARAAPVAPTIPSRANVAREATIEDALPLSRINLIGVYGTSSERRALVRLPTGRFVKLKVGDRIDGGQVAQIGSDRLLYQKGNRTLALEMPNT